jgi:hypothetical protein
LRAAVEAAGGDPSFQIQGHAVPVRDADGNLDLTATFEASAPLIEAGVTDLRITVPAVVGYDESLALYSDVATKFRAALH